MYTAKQVRAALEAYGIKCRGSSEMNSEVDGEVDVNDTVHVQVGYDYMSVNQKVSNDMFRHGEIRTSLADILADVKNLV